MGIIHLTDNSITEKQQNVINMIKSNCGIVFEGSTKAEAREFISKNINSVTKKQRKVIDLIEYYCDVRFEGSTKDEAKEFINEWKFESQFRAEEASYIKRQRAREFEESFDHVIDEETGMSDYQEYLQESYAGFSPLDFVDNY